MMTTEYCPTTEIQKMEQELWTLTAKGYDIKEYNNRFHELALMCPYLTHEKKKIERYIRGLPERVKANVTSSKHASLHDEDHQRNNSNNCNNNTYHRQQNRRQKAVKAYVAAPAGGKDLLGGLWKRSMLVVPDSKKDLRRREMLTYECIDDL
nr:reverse transcriptase domain-containing protein [Tanacetum cinerariifolium]